MRVDAGVQTLLCSFCRKPQSAVQQLISSPSDAVRAYICDECIAICASLVREDPPEAAQPAIEPPPPAVVEEPPSLHQLMEIRLFEALERWIIQESLHEDAAEELARLRSVASRWLALTKAEGPH